MCVLGVYEYVLHAVHSVFDLRSCKYVLVFIKLGSDSGASWLGAVLLDLLLSACSQLESFFSDNADDLRVLLLLIVNILG